MANLFEYVKENIPISEYVSLLPQATGLHSVGQGKYRCNNFLVGGTNNTSMIIDDDAQYFKMFSNGNESGDVIKLYSLVNNTASMKEAALNLAHEMGVQVPEEYLLSSPQEESRSSLIKMMNNIADAAHDLLMENGDDDSETALAYIADRGATSEMLRNWKLGYFPSDISECRSFFRQFGTDEMLIKVGLLGGRNNTTPFMAGRLVFPIFSLRSDAISFSSRSIEGIDCLLEDSKYINTPNTPIYEKHETLLGEHLLKKNIKHVVICEGNLDVIALNEMTDDDTVAVATCGTAFTTQHASLIKRFKPETTTILFDGDKAGRKSASSLLWVSNHIKNLSINTLEEGQDPWDMFASGKTIDTQGYEPAVITASRMMSEDMEREEFIEWFEKNYQSLSFSDDKSQFFSAVMKYSGIRKNFLLSRIRQKESNRTRTQSHKEKNILPSTSILPLLKTLLSFDSYERRIVAFPLYSKKTLDKSLDLVGVQTEIDEESVYVAMGLRRDFNEETAAYVYSLSPDIEDYDVCRKELSLLLSRKCKEHINLERVKIDFDSLSVLSLIASGSSQSSEIDKLVFLFDLISRLSIKSRNK